MLRTIHQFSLGIWTAFSFLAYTAWAQESQLEPTPAGPQTQGVEFFEREIVPILQARCYECHSHQSGKAKGGLVLDSRHGWEIGGSSGQAVVPGNVEASLLIEAIRYESLEMPPKGKLPAREIALLEKWIAMGAPDPRESPTPKTDRELLWALQPIRLAAVPAVQDSAWVRDEVDAFILVKLESVGLTPAPDADRYTLLRRVTLDLTGLPPTAREIDDFVNDPSDRAFESVVDRLLASPAFGDHWARHWFDLACYADLADIDGNVLIRDAWKYRDYVIAALNSDKPLDQFIHEQIAGDLLPFDNIEQQREQIIATGYLAIGPWTLQNYIKGQLAADVVDHQIDRIGRTFLGLTLSCARCHDHKFDPVPTRDYYALAGIFHSTLTTRHDGPGVWSQITHVPLPQLPTAAAAYERLALQIGQQQNALRRELQELQRQEAQHRFSTKVVSENANSLTHALEIAANESGVSYRVSFLAGPSVWASAGQATAGEDGLLIQVLRPDGTALAHHVHRPPAWSGNTNAQQLVAASFAYQGDGSGGITLHVTSSNQTGRFSGAIDDLVIVASETNQEIFREDFDECEFGDTTGEQAHTGLAVYATCKFPNWEGGGVNHSHAVSLAKIDNTAASQPNVALQIFSGPPATSQNPRIVNILSQLEVLQQRLDEAQPDRDRALAVRDQGAPGDIPIYQRGDFQSPGEIVPRGFLSALPITSPPKIPPNSSGRLQLAQWLTHSDNPLTSRVLVNRIWHHLFGAGLVRSVDYFGVHGEKPSHPELLDFLARRLREDDHWSWKRTVRRLVLSRTYQMASSHDARGLELDPDNRLLWRMPRRRLTAEMLRDSMLAVSGELQTARGGPTLGLEIKDNIRGAGGNVNPPTWGGQIADDIRNRRSIYLPLKRARPMDDLEILSVFDFPHPSEITGARAETNVATQALFLMNAPFVKHQASRLAERLIREFDDDRTRVTYLFLRTIGRTADSDEIEAALQFLAQCSQDFPAAPGQPPNRAEAWKQLCHAVLASNRFLFRE